MSSAVAVSNARDASLELNRHRIERDEVDVFVARKNRNRQATRTVSP
jgi:hypothetical protein